MDKREVGLDDLKEMTRGKLGWQTRKEGEVRGKDGRPYTKKRRWRQLVCRTCAEGKWRFGWQTPKSGESGGFGWHTL